MWGQPPPAVQRSEAPLALWPSPESENKDILYLCSQFDQTSRALPGRTAGGGCPHMTPACWKAKRGGLPQPLRATVKNSN